MATSPFKFLDSFTKDDKEIFFGREKEIEEIYSRVFRGNLLLVYGASGTGKTSLLQCGLSNKFNDSDWLPIIVRRGNNILNSLHTALSNAAITPLKSVGSRQLAVGKNEQQTTNNKQQISSLKKSLQSLYLDHFKPIYLLFDQFEELFIFGAKDEIENFITEISKVLKSDLQCKFIFVMRGEYLEHLTQFEEQIPNFFDNRIRIEKMTRKNAAEAITGPCKVFNIEVEDGFAQNLLDKISPAQSEVELTYLQVFLDKIYKKASPSPALPKGEGVAPLSIGEGQGVRFSNQLLANLGHIGDVLSDFLEEQIAKIPDSENALTVLKAFVSTEGTKRQIDIFEINEFTRSLGKDLPREIIENFIHQFVNLRILRDKDEHGKYELRHDSLAAKIYEKITLGEKEILQVRQMIANRHSEFEMRGTLLSEDDLNYIKPYENKLFLKGKLEEFYKKSKQVIETNRKLKRRVGAMSLVSVMLLLAAVSYYLYQKNLVSRANELAAMSLINTTKDPTLAYLLAEKAYATNPKCELAVKALLDAYKEGPFYTTIKGVEYAVSPDGKNIITARGSNNSPAPDDSTIRIYDINGNLFGEIKEDRPNIEIFENSFSPDGQIFFTSKKVDAQTKNVTLWKLPGIKLHTFSHKWGPGYSMNYAFIQKNGLPNGANSFFINDGTTAIRYDMNGKELFHINNWGVRSMIAHVFPQEQSIFINTDSTVKIFDFRGRGTQTIKMNKIIANIRFLGNHLIISTIEKISGAEPGRGSDMRWYSDHIDVFVYSKDGKIVNVFKNQKNFNFSPDGKYFLATNDSTLSLWTIEGKKVFEQKGLDEEVQVSFSGNGKYILIYTPTNNSREATDIYNLEGKYVSRKKGDYANSSKDGKYGLFVDDKDNTISIFNNEGKELARLNGSNESIQDNKVAFTPDNKYVITSGSTDVIRIWKPDLKNFGHIERAYFSQDGSLLLGIPVTTPKIYDRNGNEKLRLIYNKNRKVYGQISPDNKYAFDVSDREPNGEPPTASVWDIVTGRMLKQVKMQNSIGRGIVFSYDSKYLAVVSDDHKARIMSMNKMMLNDSSFIELKGYPSEALSVDFSPVSNFIVTASADSTAIVWKMDSSKFACEKFSVIKGHTGKVNSAKFSPDGKYVLTASDDSTARIWNLKGEQVFGINVDVEEYHYMEPKEKRGKLAFAEFSKNANFIKVSKYNLDTVSWLDPVTLKKEKRERLILGNNCWMYRGDWGEPFFEKDISNNNSNNLNVSPEGNLIVYDKDQSSILITTEKKEVSSFKGNSPKFSPDGKYLMTIDDDNQLKLYPVVPEEVIRLVREENFFGNIRDFTEEEKEEFGIE